MSSKTKQIMDNDKLKMDRMLGKPLNPYIKARLLDTLKRTDINIEVFRRAGDDTYTIKDSKGTILFSFDNAWDCGYYNITVDNLIVAEMDWFENDNHTNRYQQDMFDVLNAITKQQKEMRLITEGKKTLTPEEIRALKILEWQR